MLPRAAFILAAFLFFRIPLHAQQSVCDLFEDLRKASGPHELTVKGDLFLDGKVSALAATDCDNEFVANMYQWPTVINLRPVVDLSESKRHLIENAATQIQGIRNRGKVARATAVFSGTLHLRDEYSWNSSRRGTTGNAFGPNGRFPAELVYDDVV